MYEYYGLFDSNLLFSTYKEFCRKRRVIIERFWKMCAKDKAVYRMYVYSRPFIPDKTKEVIWETITGFLYF